MLKVWAMNLKFGLRRFYLENNFVQILRDGPSSLDNSFTDVDSVRRWFKTKYIYPIDHKHFLDTRLFINGYFYTFEKISNKSVYNKNPVALILGINLNSTDFSIYYIDISLITNIYRAKLLEQYVKLFDKDIIVALDNIKNNFPPSPIRIQDPINQKLLFELLNIDSNILIKTIKLNEIRSGSIRWINFNDLKYFIHYHADTIINSTIANVYRQFELKFSNI